MGLYHAYQRVSRILNATRVDQSGADDVDVTDWTKSNDFIIAIAIYTGDKDTTGVQYNLKWRNKTDGGSFADVGAATEIHYNADTDLVNGNAVVVGERRCTSAEGMTTRWQDGEEVEGASLCDTIDLAGADYETEIHFALDCSGATDNKEYEFELYDATTGASRGTCGATITMAVGAVTRELVSTIAITTSTSESDVLILRPITSTIATTTLTSNIDLLIAVTRELAATIATTTSVSISDLNVVRELIASIDTTTSTSDIELLITWLRELVSTIAVTTSTSVSDLNVLRELVASIDTSALVADIELINPMLRELDAIIATTTATSASQLSILRELEALIATSTDNWLEDYSKRKVIVLTGGTSGNQTDYPLRAAITYDSDMQADFDDLRFTTYDGKTLLNAWLESKIDSTSAVVYIETDTPASTIEEDIYAYYGNASASSDWDADATFILADDFDDNSLDGAKWVESTNAGSLVAEQNGRLECISTAGVSGFVRSYDSHIPQNREFIVKVVQHCVDAGFKLCPTLVASHQWDVYSEANWYNYQLTAGGAVSPNKKVNGSASQVGGDSPALTTPYWLRMRVDGTTIYFDYVDNQSARPTQAQWTNISSETWSIGTGITQPNYIYLTAYNTPSTTAAHYNNCVLRQYVSNPATPAFGAEETLPRLNVLRALLATAATTTALSVADLKVLRELVASIDTTTSLSDIDLITAALRELTATIATSTATNSPQMVVLRELASSISTSTSINAAILKILREVSSTVAITTSTSASDILVLRELIAAVNTNVATSVVATTILRELTSDVATTTLLSEIDIGVGKLLEPGYLTGIYHPDRYLFANYHPLYGSGIIELVASIVTSTLTSAIDVLVLRELTSTIPISTSLSTPSLDTLRELSSVIATTTSTADITLVLADLLELSATIATTTLTSNIALNILRELSTSIDTTTSLSDIVLHVSGIIELYTTIATSTTSSSAELKVLREMLTSIDTNTSTYDVAMQVLRELESSVASNTITAGAILMILREFDSVIASTTETNVPPLTVLRALVATIDTSTSVSDVELLIVYLRELSAVIASTTSTSDADVKVLRELEAIIGTATELSDIDMTYLLPCLMGLASISRISHSKLTIE